MHLFLSVVLKQQKKRWHHLPSGFSMQISLGYVTDHLLLIAFPVFNNSWLVVVYAPQPTNQSTAKIHHVRTGACDDAVRLGNELHLFVIYYYSD